MCVESGESWKGSCHGNSSSTPPLMSYIFSRWMTWLSWQHTTHTLSLRVRCAIIEDRTISLLHLIPKPTDVFHLFFKLERVSSDSSLSTKVFLCRPVGCTTKRMSATWHFLRRPKSKEALKVLQWWRVKIKRFNSLFSHYFTEWGKGEMKIF